MMEKFDNLAYYNENAELYFNQTKEGNFEDLYRPFLSLLPSDAYILDLGCGSGRDSKALLAKGYKVDAVDGSAEMCKLATQYIGQDVKCLRFEDLDEVEKYDGIWACSSILHLTKEELPGALEKIFRVLKPHGILYASFKKGDKYEIKEGKYYNFVTREAMEQILTGLKTKAKLVEYSETLPCTKRTSRGQGVVWANYFIEKM